MAVQNLVNDEPTLHDGFACMGQAKQVAEDIVKCSPPYVFGIHGAWGSGKTSFLRQLQWLLDGSCPERLAATADSEELRAHHASRTRVVWFEAWRYQHEKTPVVALLQEIRSQLSFGWKALDETRKLGEVTIRSALMGLDDLAKKIGLSGFSSVEKTGEKYEADHLATALPADMIRGFLEDAVNKLIGNTYTDKATNALCLHPPDKARRLVVLIDDLDRCQPEAAYGLIEGIKLFLNLSNCVFVLGMNLDVVEYAVANHLPKHIGDKDDLLRLQAHEYMDKLCQCVVHLPLVGDKEIGEFFQTHLAEPSDEISDAVCSHLNEYLCLPRNPRKIKAFANTLARFLDHHGRHYAHSGPPPGDLQRQRDAKILLVMACLYHFHHEIYRMLEHDPRFFQILRQWACGEDQADKTHETLRRLKRTDELAKAADDTTGPTPTPTYESIYPDPVRGDVFRLQELIRSFDRPITDDEIREALLR